MQAKIKKAVRNNTAAAMLNKINFKLLIIIIFYVFGVLSGAGLISYFNGAVLLKIKFIYIFVFSIIFILIIRLYSNTSLTEKHIVFISLICIFLSGNYRGLNLAAEHATLLNYFITNGTIIELTGFIKNIKNENNSIFFILEIESVKNHKNKNFNITGDIPVYISVEKGVNRTLLINGDKINLKGIVEKIHEYKNPVIYYGINPLISKPNFRVKTHNTNLKIISRKKFLSLNEFFAEKIKTGFTNNFRPEIAGFLKAFILGDSSELEKNILTDFKKTGLIHVLVVSGSHLTLLISLINSLLKKLKLDFKFSFLIIGTITTSYIAIVGIQAAVVRAYIAFMLCQLASLAGREKYEFQILAAAFFIQVLIWPNFIFNFGFWLSYIATIMLLASKSINIFYFLDKTKICNHELIKAIFENINACVITTAGTYPAIAYFTGFLPACTIFSNILTLWIYELVLILAILFVFFYITITPLCMLIAPALFFISFVALKINSFLSLIMQYNLAPYDLSFIEVFLLYAAILIFSGLFFDNLKILLDNYINFNFLLKTSIIIILLITVKSFILQYQRGFEMYFIDTGQGDCTLIRTEKGRYILIDAGGSNENVYEKILLPLFQKIRVNKIEYLIITHGHYDHYCAALKLLESGLIIKNWIYSDSYSNETEYKRLLLRLDGTDQNQVYVKAGNELDIDNINFKFLWPGIPNHKINFRQNENDCSIAFLMSYKNLTAFFGGDISQNVENELITKIPDAGVKILKVAHHGSKTSSSEEFIKKLRPELSFVYAAENNKFGHPHKKSAEILGKYSKLLLVSKESGGIIIIPNGNKFDIVNYKAQKISSIY